MEPSIPEVRPQPPEDRHRSIRILANSLLKELLSHGYSASHVVRLASELLGLLTNSIRGSSYTPAQGTAATEGE